jgi:hypothetical protein
MCLNDSQCQYTQNFVRTIRSLKQIRGSSALIFGLAFIVCHEDWSVLMALVYSAGTNTVKSNTERSTVCC